MNLLGNSVGNSQEVYKNFPACIELPNEYLDWWIYVVFDVFESKNGISIH